MPHPFISFFSPLLLLFADAPREPDFSEVAECATNESEISNLQLMRAVGLLSISELKQKQEDGTISEEENAVLFLIEIRLHEVGAVISLREHLRYYCLHPERRPKPVIDPRTVA